MIIIRIHGGLGNQLFQYAYALYLKKILNLNNVYFERLRYKGEIDRPLSISKFNLTSFNLINSDFGRFNNSKINKLYNIIFNYNRYIIEGSSKLSGNYLPRIIPNQKIFLDGYWQKFQIVNEVEDILRSEFILNTSISSKLSDTEKLIMAQCYSVSLHIRKTDYVSIKKNNSIFANCSVNYYTEAIEYMLNNVSQDISIFIFSDDFNWVKKHLHIKSNHYLIEGNSDIEDLYLMSLCKHNITANSTFSWWGAWLNTNKSKIVTTPSTWFLNGMSEIDLVPHDWIRIQN
jgi:hypothetical protein